MDDSAWWPLQWAPRWLRRPCVVTINGEQLRIYRPEPAIRTYNIWGDGARMAKCEDLLELRAYLLHLANGVTQESNT